MPMKGSPNRDLGYIFLWKPRQKIQKENNASCANYSIVIFNINSWRYFCLSIFIYVTKNPFLEIDGIDFHFLFK